MTEVGCKVFLFEPHPKFYATCVERFANNKNVTLLNFGISDADGQFLLSDNVDSSSFLSPSITNKKSIVCKVREILSVLEDLNIKKIDLMKINIEGGEYPLLIHLAKLNSLDLVKEYQIQFHDIYQYQPSNRSFYSIHLWFFEELTQAHIEELLRVS